jgi:hypothetical protein
LQVYRFRNAERAMDTRRDGRTVRHKGNSYHFRTVEQAVGFFHALEAGKSVEASRKRWRPATVKMATASGSQGVKAADRPASAALWHN